LYKKITSYVTQKIRSHVTRKWRHYVWHFKSLDLWHCFKILYMQLFNFFWKIATNEIVQWNQKNHLKTSFFNYKTGLVNIRSFGKVIKIETSNLILYQSSSFLFTNTLKNESDLHSVPHTYECFSQFCHHYKFG